MGRPIYQGRPSHQKLSLNPFLCIVSFLSSLCSDRYKRVESDDRPHVDTKIEGVTTPSLVDSGAGLSCMSEKFFNRIPLRWKLTQVPVSPSLRLSSATGTGMEIVGRYLVKVGLLGREVYRPIYVVRGLVKHDVILGIDFIREQQLIIDGSDVFFKKLVNPESYDCLVLKPVSDLVLHSRSVQPVMCNVLTATGSRVPPGTLITAYSAGSNVGLWDSMNEVDAAGQVPVVVLNSRYQNLIIAPDETMGFAHVTKEEDIIPINDEVIMSIFGSIGDDPPEPSSERAAISQEEKDFILANVKIAATQEWTQRYLDLILRYHDTCSKGKFDLGRTGIVKHSIKLKTEEPIHIKQFRIPLEHVDVIHDWVDELLKKGAIEVSRSAYNSPIFLVPKPHGGLRAVLDYRKLNLASLPDRYTIREIRDCVDEVGRLGSRVFTTIDLTSGFWQQELEEESRQFTAFTVPGKGTRYQWTVTPMGLQGSPSSFARLIDFCMRAIKGVICYIDDVLIHSKDHEAHLVTLEKVLMRLRKYNLKLNVGKTTFGADKVSYLGYTLTGEGVGPGPEKLKAIRELAIPTSVRKIREALGLCNFFRFLIPNYQKYAAHLSKLLKKSSEYTEGPMPLECQEAFQVLKSSLAKGPVVAHPRPGLDYHLRTDAAAGDDKNPGGFGAVLTQEWPEDGKERVISYASRALKDFEKNYSPYLLELAAAAWAIDYYHVYLKGRKFQLYTDHKPLEALSTIHKKTLNRLQQQMLEYDFTVHYVKGCDNGVADALSRSITAIRGRNYFPVNLRDEESCEKLISSLSDSSGSLAEAQQVDPFVKDVIQELNGGLVAGSEEHAKRVSRIAKNCFIKDGVVFYHLHRNKGPSSITVLAPQVLREHILRSAHTTWDGGHGGEDRTLNRITLNFWWPGISADVDRFIHRCLRCQEAKGKRPAPAPLQNLPICEHPNERVHLDLFGPLKTSLHGNKMILVMTDAFTKMTELASIEDKKAETVARAFFERWVCRYSVPKLIVTDNGREFSNQVLTKLCDFLGIDHNLTSPYHPQANSSAESYNRQMRKYLTSVLENHQTLDWEEWLPMMMFSYNTHIHQATKHSPFFLTYLHDPRLPYFDIEKPRALYGQDYVTHSWQIAKKCFNEASNFLNEQAIRSKHYYDAKASERDFRLGQQVMLHQEQVPQNVNKKFYKPWSGPYVIVKKHGKLNLLIQKSPRSRPILVHVNRVKQLAMPDLKRSSVDSSKFDQTQEPHDPIQQQLSWDGQVTAEEHAHQEVHQDHALSWPVSVPAPQGDHAEDMPQDVQGQQAAQVPEEVPVGPAADPAPPSPRLTRSRAAASNAVVPPLWPTGKDY